MWWDLTLPNTAGLTYKHTRELNLEGGLTQNVFGLIIGETDFAIRAIQTIVSIIGDSPETRTLLTNLQLDSGTESDGAGPVVRRIPVEEQLTEDFAAEYKALSRKDRTRKEAKLQKRYERYLNNALRHKTCRHEICVDDQTLYTDLYDETIDDLIEVKSSVERSTMRLALGQILDYAKIINPTNRTILVPRRPVRGIIELFHHHGVRVVWRDGQTFIASRPAEEGPA
ncbi:hypothetical protein [Mycobacterium sp. OAE908]